MRKITNFFGVILFSVAFSWVIVALAIMDTKAGIKFLEIFVNEFKKTGDAVYCQCVNSKTIRLHSLNGMKTFCHVCGLLKKE